MKSLGRREGMRGGGGIKGNTGPGGAGLDFPKLLSQRNIGRLPPPRERVDLRRSFSL
ncbi:hypothetical protein TRIP_E100122 [uncultured Spirochaetota bacterium]|nr:hypothetical protein TRIP_E100122 [uncultured Spirochaetota bacterium]